jgi:hypothetical protein
MVSYLDRNGLSQCILSRGVKNKSSDLEIFTESGKEREESARDSPDESNEHPVLHRIGLVSH